MKKYFHEIAHEFDGIYDNTGGLKNRIINRMFRKSLYERAPVTIEECGDITNKTILDLGCGSGRISFQLADKDAKVIGIDYAENMIELANKYKEKFYKKENIQFYQADFMKEQYEKNNFNITIALGVFDYVKNPNEILEKIKQTTSEKIVASFPAKYNFQSYMRKIWLKTRNCPVYYYTETSILKEFEKIELYDIKIIKLPKKSSLAIDFVAVANIK